MRRCVLMLIVTGLFAGCGSSGNTDKSWLYPPIDTVAQTRKAEFETRTDTVTTVAAKQHTELSSLYNTAPVRFMVQIGSFKEAKLASAVQSLARERYKLPVVNDYNAARGRYQIRVGFFETEQGANEFLLKLKTDYPQEYNDAWIVQLSK